MGYNEVDREAPFNMAVATLMRLDSILQQIKVMTITITNEKERQKAYLNLVKQFFLNAIPLLDDNVIKDKKKKIMDLTMKQGLIAKNGRQNRVISYSESLEKELDNIMIELQQNLRRFFMPTGKDLRRAVEF